MFINYYQLADELSHKPTNDIPDQLLVAWGAIKASASGSSRPSHGTKSQSSEAESDFRTALMDGIGFAAGAFMGMSTMNSQGSSTRNVYSCQITRGSKVASAPPSTLFSVRLAWHFC